MDTWPAAELKNAANDRPWSALDGEVAANNTPDKANFPSGVVYQCNANFNTNTLFGLDGITSVPISIDPFFFKYF
jgi:hypothetical protein